MVLDKLGENLKNILNKISSSNKIDRELIEEIVKEIQKSLLNADVNVRLVLELTNEIKKKALKTEIKGLNKKEQLITLIYEELAKFLGDGKEFTPKEGQNKLLLIGLYGQGKTTTAGKLGVYFKNRGSKIALISLDVWRPAAYEQLKQLGNQRNIPVFGNPDKKNPIEIYKEFEEELKKYDLVIIDTAGRDNLTDELVEEIEEIYNYVNPTDTFLVMGADLGQNAGRQAEAFKEKLNITGVIITKLEGTGKGGGALTACTKINAPVRFIGTGEKIEELEKFNSEKFVSQLLGMGDISTLLEKAKIAIDEEKAKDMSYKLLKGEFDLNDLYEQLKAMKKMGSFSKLINLIPGLNSLKIDKNELEVQEKKMEIWKYAMNSMTRKEKKHPEIIDTSRLKRISTGSGVPIETIRELLKHYKQTKKLFKNINKENFNLENLDMKTLGKLAKKKGFKF